MALAFGAMFQHSGVVADERHRSGFSFVHFLALFRNRSWILGLGFLCAGTVANVIALALAPVMVVQPIGAISLVISVLLAVKYRGLKLSRLIVAAVIVCGLSVGAFVALSATVARTSLHLGADAHPLAWIGFALTAAFLVLGLAWRRPPQLLLILGAGLLFACVATSTHLVSHQLLHAGLGAITWLNVVSLAAAGIVGSWFMQAAYAAGPPEMVIAGLTVVDPIFAVFLGSVVLGEAAGAPIWLISILVLIGLVACSGVVVLSRYHPDVIERERERRSARALLIRTPDAGE